MAEMKLTQKDKFEMIKNMMVNGVGTEADVETIVTFCDEQIKKLDEKAERAREAAAKRRAAGDVILEPTFDAVTDEWQTRNEIADVVAADVRVKDIDITPAKVGTRLTTLVKAGRIVKEQQGKDRKMAYKLA